MFYVRPDESFTYGSATGTVETDYLPSWIVDGRSNRPARGATTLALTATALASRSVSLLAIVNHNIVGTTVISGGVTATIPAAAARTDGAYENPWVSITPVAATSLVMTVTNTPSIVGELIAGTRRTIKNLLPDTQFEPTEPFAWEEGSAIPPNDSGILVPRRLSGTMILTDAELADAYAWEQSTRRGSRPTLLIPNEDIVQAWFGIFRLSVSTNYYATAARRAAGDASIHRVDFQFAEIPMLRWLT